MAVPNQAPVAPLAQPVSTLWGVGGERAAQLAKLRIQTVEDLLLHRPRRYEDRRHFRAISILTRDEAALTRGTAVACGLKRFRGGRKSVVELILDDGTARLHCRWWNLPFMEHYFKLGDEVVVFGKPNSLKPRTIDHPETEVVESGDERFIHFNRIVPIYPLTEGLPQRWLRGLIWRTLERHERDVVELFVGQASSLSSHLPQAGSAQGGANDSSASTAEGVKTGKMPVLPFRSMDKDAPVAYYGRHLPHWRQDGATYFVTFRLADSIPQEKLRQWEAEMTLWLQQHPEPRTEADRAEYTEQFTERFHQWMDAGMGECRLKEATARAVVEEALKHSDGERYWLGHYAIMPNHLHVVVRPIQGHPLKEILHSWKSFTANRINELTERRGKLWQDESFDLIVRNEHHLEKVAHYIQENPMKARLKPGSYTVGSGTAVNVGQASSLSSNAPSASTAERAVTGKMPVLRSEAIHMLHFPEEQEDAELARRRLALDEFIALQHAIRRRRLRFESKSHGLPCRGDNRMIKPFLAQLGFTLTGAQTRVLRQVRQDMGGAHPMRRLLQGDVGSGKTAVAACAALMALESGFNGVLMAPTEILAEQHFRNFTRWFEPLGIPVAMQTGSRKTAEAGSLEMGNGRSGSLDAPRNTQHGSLIIGTHALLTEGFEVPKLGLVIVDEQHKFGVTQREELVRKGNYPHLLVMTATPIPRTLGLTLYGDLDLSIIDEMPAGRGRVRTFVRSAQTLPKVWEFVKDKLNGGRQAYIVYPRVEETSGGTTKAVLKEFERIQAALTPHRVGLLHGRLRANEKESVMADFRANRVQVLVATSLIEVGVDVSNATVMVIENAEHFGLAQLHQLRGRIGRGTHESHCVLVSDKNTSEVRARLKVLEETTDGFQIAEADLKLRGPGELLGQQQSGLPRFRFADLREDFDLVQQARQCVNVSDASDNNCSASGSGVNHHGS